MLTCPKCNAQNPLGKVFCGTCGSKLELAGVTTEAVAQMGAKGWFARHWLKMVIGVASFVCLFLGLSYWPQAPKLGDQGVPVGARKIESTIRMMAMLKPGVKISPVIKEGDLNSYLDSIKNDLGADAVTVQMQPGILRIRVMKRVFNFKVGKRIFCPLVTRDIYCVSGGSFLYPRKAQKGHLGLFGPGKTMVIRQIHQMFSRQRNWGVLKNVTDIKIEDGQISFNVVGK